jgi:hypothetical protein
MRKSTLKRPLLLTALALGLVLAGASPALGAGSTAPRQTCAYSQESISALENFASNIGSSSVNCALVYANPSTWTTWTTPWYLNDGNDASWAEWVRSAPRGRPHTLLISMPMVADTATSAANWRATGAAGDFRSYDIALAQNLVSAGLGRSIIDLAPESNGTWEKDWVGSTAHERADWVSAWRKTVLAMRSVSGASFTFVWDVNNREPATPFRDYYPGDNFVNVIGDDVYDEVSIDGNGWTWSDGGVEGVAGIIAFARAHKKPVAFPEWGSGIPTSTSISDDPGFMQGMISTIKTQDVAFQSYFLAHSYAAGLLDSPQSFRLYRDAFGDHADSIGARASRRAR